MQTGSSKQTKRKARAAMKVVVTWYRPKVARSATRPRPGNLAVKRSSHPQRRGDLRATHARTLLPAALASVSFGFVLVRVRRTRYA